MAGWVGGRVAGSDGNKANLSLNSVKLSWGWAWQYHFIQPPPTYPPPPIRNRCWHQAYTLTTTSAITSNITELGSAPPQLVWQFFCPEFSIRNPPGVKKIWPQYQSSLFKAKGGLFCFKNQLRIRKSGWTWLPNMARNMKKMKMRGTQTSFHS